MLLLRCNTAPIANVIIFAPYNSFSSENKGHRYIILFFVSLLCAFYLCQIYFEGNHGFQHCQKLAFKEQLDLNQYPSVKFRSKGLAFLEEGFFQCSFQQHSSKFLKMSMARNLWIFYLQEAPGAFMIIWVKAIFLVRPLAGMLDLAYKAPLLQRHTVHPFGFHLVILILMLNKILNKQYAIVVQ